MEDLLYEAESVRQFVGLKLSGALPDETTILNFRHLLEQHNLGPRLLGEINAHLESQGLKLREGTIVDATIIEAPSSTKNRTGERDPEMHQTKKGNQWHFGMKAHIGVDSATGIVHSMTTAAANAHDITEAHNLLHGRETVVWGHAGYQGVGKREETQGLEVEWQVAMRPGKRRKLDPQSAEALAEKAKASVRAKSLPPTAIGGGASLPEVEASVRLWESPLPGVDEEHTTAGAFVRAGQPADGGGTTEGVVGPAAGPNKSNGLSKPPNAPSGGNIQGAERHQQGRKGNIRPLTDRGRLNSGQNGPCSEYP